MPRCPNFDHAGPNVQTSVIIPASLGHMRFRQRLPPPTIRTYLSVNNYLVFGRGSLAALEHLLTPFYLIIPDMPARPSLVYLCTHFSVVPASGV